MRNALIADYDIVNEQHTIMNRLETHGNLRMEFRRVKITKRKKDEHPSHIETRSLSTKELAQKQEHTSTDNRTALETLTFDTCEIYLWSGDTPVYSDEKETARWKWADFQVQEYYCEKFGLTTDELHTIDWYNLRRARIKLPTTIQTFSTKYNIDWLATGSRMELQGDLVTKCIHCGLYEGTAHLLRCVQRKEKIASLLDRFVNELTEHKSDPRIIRVLKYYVAKQIHCPTNMRKPNIKDLETAINEQETIGWDRFVKGIWSSKWDELQTQYETRQKIKDSNWTRDIIIWLIETGYEKWTERNNAIHSAEVSTTTRAHEEAVAQVSELYARENETTLQDRDIFETTLSTRLQQSTKALQTWYRHMKEKITNSILSQQERILRQQPLIRDWIKMNSARIEAAATSQKDGPMINNYNEQQSSLVAITQNRPEESDTNRDNHTPQNHNDTEQAENDENDKHVINRQRNKKKTEHVNEKNSSSWRELLTTETITKALTSSTSGPLTLQVHTCEVRNGRTLN